jgi:arylsulfatase A-like enzyme
MDWVATFLEAAGVSPHADYPLDGISLLKPIQSPLQCLERDLFWRMKFRSQKAVRSGPWKWLSLEGNEFLYDLARDPRERANRALREAERFAEMRARYAAWEKTVPPIPPDALVSLIGTPAELAKPS